MTASDAHVHRSSPDETCYEAHSEPQHTQDEHCTVDPETLCCVTCGVDHGGGCRSCAGLGFHKPGCPDSDEARV